MSTRILAVSVFDFLAPAFQPVSGNASGTTPKVSGWIKLGNVESITLALATASSTGCTWSAKVAPCKPGQPSVVDAVNAVALDPAYLSGAFPTGTNQSATVTVTMPEGKTFLQLTATPTAGSGAITATPGLITGRAAWVHRYRDSGIGIVLDCPAAATLAGQAAIDYSPNVTDDKQGLAQLPETSAAEPAIWFPATDRTDTAITIAALVASTGQTISLRQIAGPFVAVRVKFTPSAGFGRYRALLNAKG